MNTYIKKLLGMILTALFFVSVNVTPIFAESLVNDDIKTNDSTTEQKSDISSPPNDINENKNKDEITNNNDKDIIEENNNKSAEEAISQEPKKADDNNVIKKENKTKKNSLMSINDYAVPSESDYNFSSGKITGLKSSYIAGLSDEQKLNIRLEIPGSINGVDVTSIGDNAFKSSNYANCKITYLDISKCTKLKSIGEWAFYNNTSMEGTVVLPDTLTTISNYAFYQCSKISGSLMIPNSVTSIGTYAFSGCSSMKGSLSLSNSLNVISNYAFSNSGFTGNLTIPSGVTAINNSAFRQSNSYNGFTSVVIPEGVTMIDATAFSYQNALTNVAFPKNSLIEIKTSAFRYSGLTGVLKIPETVQKIGANAFASTKLTTVYIPENAYSALSDYIVSSTFSSSSNLTAIVCSSSNYTNLYNILISSDKPKLGYPVTLKFDDGNGGSYNSIERLYNHALNFVKNKDDTYSADTSYELPKVIGNENKKWAFSSTALEGVNVNTKVTSSTLYAIEPLTDPTLSFSDDIDLVYDGNAHTVKVTASHPLYKPISEAKSGDVVFYYTWRYATIGTSSADLKGFDKNEFSITDVREPRYAIACDVTIQTCLINGSSAKPFNTQTHTFAVLLKQAEPTVNPVFNNKVDMTVTKDLPEISLGYTDTKGVISWDEGQTLKEGTNEYKWTFTPENNPNGISNYKTVTGSSKIEGIDKKDFILNILSGEHGKVSPAGDATVTQGNDFTMTFTPDKGYKIGSLKLDDKDITSDVKDNKYTLKDIQKSYDIKVSFEKITPDDVEDMINTLPVISDDKDLTAEEIDDILDIKENYETLNNSSKENVTYENKQDLCEALSKVPQIDLEVTGENQSINVNNSSILLDNLTSDDIKIIKDDPDTKIKLCLDIKNINSNNSYENIINKTVKDIDISNYFDISVKKEVISSGGNNKSIVISNLSYPIKLSFDIPKDILSSNGTFREFFIVRLHEEGGTHSVDILKDEDDIENTITVSSDKFSVYALSYKDSEAVSKFMVKASSSKHGSISPLGNIEVKKGENKTFYISPDKCYEVDYILIDGKKIKAAEKYTFKDIDKNHSIKAVFKPSSNKGVSVSCNSENTDNTKSNVNNNSSDKSNIVDTSDMNNIILYAGIGIASLVIILAVLIYIKKHD